MNFCADWRTYNARYGSGLMAFLSMLLFMIIRPLSAGKGFMFFEMFHGMFLRDIRITGTFLGIILFCQLIGYYSSRKEIKLLTILENKITINIFNGKIFEFKYSDLTSTDLVFDTWLGNVFEFTFKDGTKQKISDSIKNKELALKLIQQKISEFNQSNIRQPC